MTKALTHEQLCPPEPEPSALAPVAPPVDGFAVLVERARELGAPDEFLERARELRGGEPDTVSPKEERTARARLGQFLVAAGFAERADLPAGLRGQKEPL